MLVNSQIILQKAKKEKYAIPQFNINNLEWTKYILEECNELNIPVILGVSESAIKYMGGYKVVVNIVNGLIEDLNISIPVCLHLDHGSSVENCEKAINSGFTSVMIDKSKLSLEENIEETRKVVEYAHTKNVTVEAEIGKIGRNKNSLDSKETNATVEECIKFYSSTGIDSIAPALGSVHGFYQGEPNLNFLEMKKISEAIDIPLVLHGGTGIPSEKIKTAIECGISKININTDLQVVWSTELKKYIKENEDVYDPRKIIESGKEAIKSRIKDLVTLFGTKL